MRQSVQVFTKLALPASGLPLHLKAAKICRRRTGKCDLSQPDKLPYHVQKVLHDLETHSIHTTDFWHLRPSTASQNRQHSLAIFAHQGRSGWFGARGLTDWWSLFSASPNNGHRRSTQARSTELPSPQHDDTTINSRPHKSERLRRMSCKQKQDQSGFSSTPMSDMRAPQDAPTQEKQPY